jgi:hypothetical protein
MRQMLANASGRKHDTVTFLINVCCRGWEFVAEVGKRVKGALRLARDVRLLFVGHTL